MFIEYISVGEPSLALCSWCVLWDRSVQPFWPRLMVIFFFLVQCCDEVYLSFYSNWQPWIPNYFEFFLCFRNQITWQLRSLILATDITRQQEFLSRFKVCYCIKSKTTKHSILHRFKVCHCIKVAQPNIAHFVLCNHKCILLETQS
jgi:hypothetical protein